jgi:flavin-binding protein dodecin
MAIEWVTAGKIALAAGQAFMAHLQGRKDDDERERDRDLLLAAIKRAQDEILNRLNLLEVNQLRGELEGFQLIYASYDPDPNDPVEESRLVTLIDDSARVLGRLGAHLDTVGSNPDLALEAWAIYVPLLYLRAQAMTERGVTYGAEETTDALVSFDMALPRLAGLLSYLRGQSDSQFGPVVCKPIPDSQDSRVCWYWWGNEQFICGSTRDPKGVEKCQKSRATNMDAAYRAFEGVREITAAADQLQEARDVLDTISALDLLTHRGVDVGDVIIVRGRLVRSLPRADASATAADSAPSQEWFS